MQSIIIMGFSGIGKSFLAEHIDNAIDIDSGLIHDGFLSKEQYINKIKKSLGVYKYILVGTQQFIRDEVVVMNEISVLMYPDLASKRSYILRYMGRNNSYHYLKRISENWDRYIDSLMNDKRFTYIMLQDGKFLYDYLKDIGELLHDKI